MKEHYEKILKLRYRDRITSSDVNFIQSMHIIYCSQLKKNICWQCPNSIREAIFDLIHYVEKNPLQDESKDITIEQPIRTREGDKQIPKGDKNRKPSTRNRQ